MVSNYTVHTAHNETNDIAIAWCLIYMLNAYMYNL